MSEPQIPGYAVAAVAQSPDDQSSDRVQSDADQVTNIDRNTDDRVQSDANQVANVGRNTADRLQADSNQVALILALEKLSTSSDSLTVTTAEATRAELRAEVAQRRRILRSILAMGVVMAVFLSALMGIAIQGFSQRSKLAGCVDPSGACFKEGQARTAKAVGDISRVVVLAASCASSYVQLPIDQRAVAIQMCITRGLHKP